jgi:mannitol 2-dehydrogenase
MSVSLSLSALADLDPTIAQPTYNRADLSAGIVHIGLGNFHRAHMAVYLDDLFNQGRSHDWAVVGAGIKAFDAERRALLKKQDWLTTVVDLAPGALSARVTGPMIDFCEVDQLALGERIADPAIRIVSLTITEGGYFVDAATGGFDVHHPDIVADAKSPHTPKTVFGILLEGLSRRRERGVEPFTVLSCDNLPENGHVARQAVLGLAMMISEDLEHWVADNVAFPNSMVDRITPATSDREIMMVEEQFGIRDAAPTVCEPFRQWILEDNFPTGRPALEHVGVEFVDDVTPFELMKLRILNGGHAAIAYVGALLGHTYVHEAMNDPVIARWLDGLMRREVIPLVPKIAGISFEDYLATCIERFANPMIGDTIARLCFDGSNRQPKFILPTIREAVHQRSDLDGLALEVALWCAYCASSADGEIDHALDDERADLLKDAAVKARTDPVRFLQMNDVFGDLGASPVFADAFGRQLQQVESLGARAALLAYLDIQGAAKATAM